MQPKPRHRRSKPAPINLDELANDPGLRGMLSFLEVPPEEKARRLALRDEAERLQEEQTRLSNASTFPASQEKPTVKRPTVEKPTVENPTEQAPPTEKPTVERPTLKKPTNEKPTVETPTVPLPATTSIEEDEPPLDAAIPPPAAPRLYRATLVQHGHSSGEQNLYMAMWNNAKPEPGRESRLIKAGYDTLARLANLNEKTVRINLRRLIDKLSIELARKEDSDHRQGRIYRVYSFAEVLTRRRTAGMIWVRRTRGVEFVANPEAPLDADTTNDVPSEKPTVESPTVESPTVGKTPTVTVGKTPTVTVGKRPTPLVISFSNSFQESSSSSSTAVIQALRSHTTEVDDDAVTQLLSACRDYAPDATDDEIIHFIHAKAGKPGIRKPLGFLLTAVPRCFEGESFRQFRQDRQKQTEEQAIRAQQFQREAEALLNDPSATQEERDWANEILHSE